MDEQRLGNLFEQPGAPLRLALVRITAASVVTVLLVFGPYDAFFVSAADLVYRPGGVLSFLPPIGRWFLVLKAICLAAGALAAAGVASRVACGVLAVSFSLLSYYVSRFSSGPWNYNTHIPAFLVVLALCDCGRRLALVPTRGPGNPERERLALSVMQLHVGTIYLQAAVSKVVGTGWRWFTSGTAAWNATVQHNPQVASVLEPYRNLFVVGSVATGILEFGFILLVPFRRAHLWIALGAIAFHMTTWVVLGISFWHLWVFYPALFLIANRGRGYSGRRTAAVATSRMSPPDGEERPRCTVSC